MKPQPEVIVCVGTGGVGKTTVSAAIGVAHALKGRKTLVMTIDPAKRLAQSMGLNALKGIPTPIPLPASGGMDTGGRLYAMILETRTTFNNLIRKYSESPQKADAILNNSYYRYVSGELAGSEDYMAMEKLYEIKNEYDYDLIVVDTPPARHAINFLTAPNRLIQLISSGVLKWLVKPSMSISLLGLNILNRAPQKVVRLLKSYVGLEIVEELTDFFGEFEELYSGFKTRAKDVQALLASKKVRFYMVTMPTRDAVEEAVYFYSIMKGFDINFAGFIINKVHGPFYGSDALRDDVSSFIHGPGIDERLRRTVEETLSMDRLARHDKQLTDYLKTRIRLSRIEYHTIYLMMDRELTNLSALVELSKALDGI
ncbi:MAG: AAA family ATPase [Deltaproteobacteria bacterium]|nr:AAA family ATPase [Deltaproteobacteria bacterium]